MMSATWYPWCLAFVMPLLKLAAIKQKVNYQQRSVLILFSNMRLISSHKSKPPKLVL